MVINELTQKECSDILSHTSLGRLGCALDDQPYVVPVYFAYDGSELYVLSTLGQKIEWMRANPKVCVQVDEIQGEAQWVSIVINGRYQELPEIQYAAERAHARKLFEKRNRWWQTAMAERQLKVGVDLIAPLFFRIHIDSMTGLRALPEIESQSPSKK
jgi:nitroimidazol reductase NimA-like FMN-containing flavoprotein (pyridoxamine 5'-phosphate oxidase superfamily)